METKCFKIKLKPNSLTALKEWSERLKQDHQQVVQSLLNESVVVESVFLDETTEGDFLIYYMKCDDLKKAQDTAKKSKLDIDKYHSQVMSQICESSKALECLLDVSLI